MDAGVQLRHLVTLIAVAEEGRFTDAAIRLNVSQSGVSRTVAQLEHIVGNRLVDRTTREVHLTDTGQAFYRAARHAIRAVEDAMDAGRGEVRPLHLGYSWAAFGRDTTVILRRWSQVRPDVAVTIHRIDSRPAGLDKGMVDVAVIRGEIDDASLHHELLYEESRRAALPADHPLAGHSRVRINELKGPVVLTPMSTTTLDLWPVEVRPTTTTTVDNIDEWLTTIAAGTAIGVTPESTAFMHPHPGICFVPLDGVPDVPVNLAWPILRPHPAITEFARCVHDHIKS